MVWKLFVRLLYTWKLLLVSVPLRNESDDRGAMGGKRGAVASPGSLEAGSLADRWEVLGQLSPRLGTNPLLCGNCCGRYHPE